MKRKVHFQASWQPSRANAFWECVAGRLGSRHHHGVVCGNTIIPNPTSMKQMLDTNSAFLCEFLIDAKTEDK